MKLLAVAFVIVAIAAVILTVLKKRAASGDSDAPWPFYPKKPLTQPEQILYHRLVAAFE